MKNSILIFAAFCISIVAGAQEKEWKIALHVDPNFSWMKPDNKNIESGDSKLRFGYGIMIDKMFTDNYAFGTGFNIVQMGGQLTYLYSGLYRKDGSTSNTEVVAERVRTYKLQYIEIPLTLKLRTNEIGYVTYWAQMGVGLGVNIRSRADEETIYARERVVILDNPDTPETDESSDTWETSGIRALSTEDEDIKDDIRLFRASLIVAAGIEYNLSGNASILAGITFNNGFVNVLNNEGVKKDTAGNPDIYNKKPVTYDLKSINNFIALNIGFLF